MEMFEVLHAFWESVVHLFSEYEPFIRILSYFVSPILAYLAFRANRRDRKEIIEQSTELGRLSNEVDNAHRDIREKQHELSVAQKEIDARGQSIDALEDDLRRITEGSQALWKLRSPTSFQVFESQLWDPKGARIITVGNLKGGVGKTTLAANLAAYISETRGQPVLLVDLDYQGSLSNMMMLAIEKEEVASNVDRLFEPDANLITLESARIHLAPKINRGWLVPANYDFAEVENKLLLKWLLKSENGVDVRFRLASALLRSEVRYGYAAIIFDIPPRMTLGAINALCASHHLIVPTVLDKLSAEAIAQFLTQAKAVKRDLNLHFELAGIVGWMTRVETLTGNEPRAFELARDAGRIWNVDVDYMLPQTLPRRVAIGNAAGEDVAYFLNDSAGPLKRLFDPLFAEICKRIGLDSGRLT